MVLVGLAAKCSYPFYFGEYSCSEQNLRSLVFCLFFHFCTVSLLLEKTGERNLIRRLWTTNSGCHAEVWVQFMGCWGNSSGTYFSYRILASSYIRSPGYSMDFVCFLLRCLSRVWKLVFIGAELAHFFYAQYVFDASFCSQSLTSRTNNQLPIEKKK